MRAPLFTALLIGAMLLGLALRTQDLGRESLWLDEASQFLSTDQGIGAWAQERWRSIDPPLNDLIAYVWNNGFRAWVPAHANDEAVIRTPVVAFGVTAIAVAGLAARAAFGPVAGIVAAFLLATNVYHLRYSQEARMHSLVPLLAMCAMLFMVRTLDRGRARDATWFAVFAAGAVYAHYFALLPLFAAVAVTGLLWRRDRDERLQVLLRGELLALAIALPYVGAQVLQGVVTNQGARAWLKKYGPPTFHDVGRTARSYVLHGIDALASVDPSWPYDGAVVTAALLAVGVLFTLGIVVRRTDEPAYLHLHLLAIAFGPLAAIFLVSQVRPIYHPRYLLGSLPALVLLVVRARPVWLVGLLALFPITLGVFVEPRYHDLLLKPQYREAGTVLARKVAPGDLVDVYFVHAQSIRLYASRAAGPESPAVHAIRRGMRRGDITPETLDLWRRTLAEGRRVFEVDVALPSAGLRAGSLRARLERPAEKNRVLVFESQPLPYLRLWRRERLDDEVPVTSGWK